MNFPKRHHPWKTPKWTDDCIENSNIPILSEFYCKEITVVLDLLGWMKSTITSWQSLSQSLFSFHISSIKVTEAFDKFSGDLKDPGSLIADIEVVGQWLAADGAKMLLGEAQWLKEKGNICSILLKAYQLASSTMSIASESWNLLRPIFDQQ